MQLPDRPNLRHLRDQAKKLARSAAALTLADAQFKIAQQYGFESWPKLKQHVEAREKAGQLKQAIATGEVALVKGLLAENPELRLLLIEELMCASQPGQSAKMEFLVRAGADVNGLCWGWYPVIFCPCENLQPEPLKWLLDHGADPNRVQPKTGRTALDYVIDTYPSAPKQLTACIEMLLAAGGRTPVAACSPCVAGRSSMSLPNMVFSMRRAYCSTAAPT